MRAGIGIRLAAAGFAALVAVLLLSIFPSPGGVAMDKEKAVFRVQQPALLDQGSLVDRLSAMSLTRRITRVEWTGAVLKIDLDGQGAAPGGTDWLGDIRQLAGLSFVQAANVSRLLVRVEDSRGTLLAAADMRRTDPWMNAEQLKDWSGINPAQDKLWASRLRLTYHSVWAAGSAGRL